MNVEKDLKSIEKKIVADFSSDGIVDFLLGITLIGYAIVLHLDMVAMMAICMFPLIFAKQLRKKITYPRIGYANPDKIKNSSKKALMIIMLLVLTLAVIITGIIVNKQNAIPAILEGKLLIIAAIIVVFFLIASALVTGIQRFYLYAPLIGGIFIFGHFQQIDVPMYLLLTGIICFIVGVVLMVRFTRKYPVIVEEFDSKQEI